MRGLLLERGITLRKGRRHLEAALPGILEDPEANLSGALRFLLAQLSLELEQTSQRIGEADAACGFDLVREPRDAAGLRVALTNSFGFGGANATLVFNKLAA